MESRAYWLLAVLAGLLLTLMLFYNGLLSRYTSPTWSSLVAHGIGALVAGSLTCIPFFRPRTVNKRKAPLWAYSGGIAGAFTVVLANIAVNSSIGLTGTISLMLLGQAIFGMIVDSLGLFHMDKRTLTLYDFFEVLTIMTGSAILIFFAR